MLGKAMILAYNRQNQCGERDDRHIIMNKKARRSANAG
jgi:hypothetical protein